MRSLQRPYLASYCMITRGNELLVQRRFNTGYLDGYWCLPSGHVQEGEPALLAASRELAEETGLIVQPDSWRFVCAMHRQTDRTIIDLFFTTTEYSGAPSIIEPDKCDGLDFYPMDALPEPVGPYIAKAVSFLKQQRDATTAGYHEEGW
jgi:8-oxo-dGTP diphosphatase